MRFYENLLPCGLRLGNGLLATLKHQVTRKKWNCIKIENFMLQMTAKEREIHIQNREIIYKSYFKAYLQNRYSICNLIKRQIMEYFK